VSIAKRMLCVYEVGLGLSKPVGSAPGHGISIADQRESWGGDRSPAESGSWRAGSTTRRARFQHAVARCRLRPAAGPARGAPLECKANDSRSSTLRNALSSS
jgi:hypothetical protein